MEKDFLANTSRLRLRGACGDPGTSHTCLFAQQRTLRHVQSSFRVLRDVCRERQTLLQARKGRSSSDAALRRKTLLDPSDLPELKEDKAETVSVAVESSSALAALNAEIMECQDATEILDIVSEEAAIMTGPNASFALMRLVNLSKSQLHKLRYGPDFTKLLFALEQHIRELGPKELAQALWSLAKARYNRPKLLRRLAEHASSLVAEFNVRDISTVIWAFGTLQYKPDEALLDDIATAAHARLNDFEPQGLSMLTWGYAKLDYVPEGDFLSGVVQRLETDISLHHHQAISNTFYGLARLHQYSPSLCSAVEAHITEHADDFTPQELMNILWAYVKFRHIPQDFVAKVLSIVQDEHRARAFRPSDWASLIWGLASLGMSTSAEAMRAINERASQHLPSMTASELCNVLWGLSVLEEWQQALFADGMRLVLDAHQQRSLEPRLLRQLLQASALARAAGVPVSLPERVEKAAAKWWRTTATTVPSLSHGGVSRTLKGLGVKHRVVVFLGDGLPTVDIALEDTVNQQRVAIQVVGPHEISANTRALLGRAAAEKRLLSANGWRPFHITVGALSDPASHQTQKIVKQLQKEGMEVKSPDAGKQPGKAAPSQSGTSGRLSPSRRRSKADDQQIYGFSGMSVRPAMAIRLPSSPTGAGSDSTGPTAMAAARVLEIVQM